MEQHDLQFDCLNYYVFREKIAYQELNNLTDEIIPYCFRPENEDEKVLLKSSVNSDSQNLTFEELYLNNVTSQQLLSWSVSIEIVEKYQLYINEPHQSLNQHFYNCTEPWFGLQCQYSFEFNGSMIFREIVENAFLTRKSYTDSSIINIPIPCYVLLECHLYGQIWCLDWREVCDGNIDCFDEGTDEQFCFDLEINECENDEYRCHNGLCIPEKLWEDGEGDAECLDRSDELNQALYIVNCFQDPTFRCEEHSCRIGSDRFPCGDGRCVSKFETCHNGRHELLINLMSAKGNLTDKCWIVMVCQTYLNKKVNGTSCKTWLNSDSIQEFMKDCDPFLQFPAIPILNGHVRLFFENLTWTNTSENSFSPNYACFNSELCDLIPNTIVHRNLTCITGYEQCLRKSMSKLRWTCIIMLTEWYFRSCLIPHELFNRRINYSKHPSLYQCQNSLKVISKHRILDGINDCFEGDDETHTNSCLLNDRFRKQCHNGKQCWSSVVRKKFCQKNKLQIQEEIPFEHFCDGIELYSIVNNEGQIDSEESVCKPEWCDNIYARCDGFWSCADGRDEYNCGRITKCSAGTLACISPANNTIICLPKNNVEDGNFDCVGGTDEQSHCRSRFIDAGKPMTFQCNKNGPCLSLFRLCDGNVDCSNEFDEKICSPQPVRCNKHPLYNFNEVEHIVCAVNNGENRGFRFFSLHTSSNYPELDKVDDNEMTQRSINQYHTMKFNIPSIESNVWPWYCNRGLVVYTRGENNSNDKKCMCPPSYYGDRCQYQNQRISLTVRLTAANKQAMYAIVIMLIDDDVRQEIEAYDQLTYTTKQSCSVKFNRYLLYSTRPKNISKNYSLRIDVFEKTELTYVGSWYFSIRFLFLPVNRVAVSLDLSNIVTHTSSNCTIHCHHGICVKYFNWEKYFCRCIDGWSGYDCRLQINGSSCLSGSIQIGSCKNQPICICPIDKFGSRCLLKSVCPMNACQNNGRCIPADLTVSGSEYTCFCSDQFYGPRCQYSKVKVHISFNKIDIPSYVVAYFFTLSNDSNPTNTVVLRKLTLFQHTVTFAISVPFHLMIIQGNQKYYLAVLQKIPQLDISTSISFQQECISGDKLFHNEILKKSKYERITSYYELCMQRHDLTCFIDETFLCLCTNDHHANCLKFIAYNNFQCPLINNCQNGAQCLQDHPVCPSTTICICRECFFGNQCQFYAKGLGSTLDEILGYEFKSIISLSKQPMTIKISAILTTIMSSIGIINCILSIMTFSRQKTREVGCGIYLFTSSVTSLSVMILFTLKFWVLYFSHQYKPRDYRQQYINTINCMLIEPLLKMNLYLNNWFDAAVAIERMMSVYQGIHFSRIQSKRVAKFVIILLPIIIICLFIPQLLNLHVYEDVSEERIWCVVKYSPWLQMYSYTLILSHYFAPFFINLFSATYIIVSSTHHRFVSKKDQHFWIHLRTKLIQYKHLILSPVIIVLLTLPYLTISIILDCKKSSNLFWFYLIGYFLSFMPATFVFTIFVLPSRIYKNEFKMLHKKTLLNIKITY